jgi:PIN domain nuclease of toxin-antitoxin system
MDFLLDTYALIWFLNGDAKLSDKAKNRFTPSLRDSPIKPWGSYCFKE